MAGGPLNNSIILDVTRYIHGIESVAKTADGGVATVLPEHLFYRDFEPEAAKLGLMLPCYTASKNLNTIGGMVGNNSAGEKTLFRYGKTEDFINELSVVFEDGNEYIVKPLSKAELDKKIAQKDFEGIPEDLGHRFQESGHVGCSRNQKYRKTPQDIICGMSGIRLRRCLT